VITEWDTRVIWVTSTESVTSFHSSHFHYYHRSPDRITIYSHLTMAIYSSVPPPSQQPSATASTAAAIDIEAWTVSALQSLGVSPSALGTTVTLSIPLDTEREDADGKRAKAAARPHKDPLARRDSQRRREALLKGKEGSRRRQRWENGE
jgi:uncharacterized membrane protein YccC